MKTLKKFFAGLVSFVLALTVLAAGGLPGYWAFEHIESGAAPAWGYAPLTILGIFTILVTIDLFRKALRGVGPLTNIR